MFLANTISISLHDFIHSMGRQTFIISPSTLSISLVFLQLGDQISKVKTLYSQHKPIRGFPGNDVLVDNETFFLGNKWIELNLTIELKVFFLRREKVWLLEVVFLM